MANSETSPSKTNKDVIAEGIAALSAQLAAGNSEALTAYLGTMSRFHNYSFGNVMAIAMQKPDAVRVAGFHTWKDLGRNVKKGEKAIRILAPLIRSRKDESTGEESAHVYGFRSVCVFDISQTEGKELPVYCPSWIRPIHCRIPSGSLPATKPEVCTIDSCLAA